MSDVRVGLIAPEINYQWKTRTIDYSQSYTKNDNVRMLIGIRNNYGALIAKYGQLFSIPAPFIASFIATESSGKNHGPNRFDATGLMQITPNAFYDTLHRRLKSGDIAADQQALVRSFAPGLQFSAKGISTTPAGARSILLKAFSNPEFNIYAGCLYMDYLVDRFAISGRAQINKVLIGYNAGAFNKVISANIAIAMDSSGLARNPLVPAESRGYLVKILGIDGFLDLILRQRLVSF